MTPAVGRLIIFISASLALHSATFGFLVPSGTAIGSHGNGFSGAALHAVLSPRSEPLAPPAEALRPPNSNHNVLKASHAKSRMPDEAASARHPRPADSNTVNRTLFDRWYTAEELDTRAEPLTLANLTYPSEVMPFRLVGRVRLALFIDEKGFVQKAKVIHSEPDGTFDAAAFEAWQHVRFTPAQKSGQSVKSEKILEIEFSPY